MESIFFSWYKEVFFGAQNDNSIADTTESLHFLRSNQTHKNAVIAGIREHGATFLVFATEELYTRYAIYYLCNFQ